METELLRAPDRARPFRSFQIHTGSGGIDPVESPENIAFTVDGKGLVVSPAGGEVALIDVTSVTGVTHDFKEPRKTSTRSEGILQASACVPPSSLNPIPGVRPGEPRS